MARLAIHSALLAPVADRPGIYRTGDFPIPPNRNLKGWHWKDIRILHGELAPISRKTPDYESMWLSRLSPGSANEFMWLEVEEGKLSLRVDPIDTCEFMPALAKRKDIFVPLTWANGVSVACGSMGIRRFRSNESVELHDGTVHEFDPASFMVGDVIRSTRYLARA